MTKLKFLLCAVIVLNVTCAFAQSNICKKDGDTTTCTNVLLYNGDIHNTNVIIDNSTINGEVVATKSLAIKNKSTINENCSGYNIKVISSTIKKDCTVKSTLYLSGKTSKIGGDASGNILACTDASLKQIEGKRIFNKIINCNNNKK